MIRMLSIACKKKMQKRFAIDAYLSFQLDGRTKKERNQANKLNKINKCLRINLAKEDYRLYQR